MLARRGMLTVSEAATLADNQAHFKPLKPWWDVLMDYLLVIMLMSCFFSATLLITMDKVVCMPKTNESNQDHTNGFHHVILPSPGLRRTGHKTNLDFQQYMYVSAVCYYKVIPWQTKYFPYLALINTLLLLVGSNFWFKYPKTSSKVELFLSILGKCFESPWTTKALEETNDQPPPDKIRIKSSSTRSVDFSPRTPLLTPVPFATIQAPVSTILDKKEEEQAKALFEKIRHFRSQVEDSRVVYQVYVGQTVFKGVQVVSALGYALSLVGAFSFRYICKPGLQNFMGYPMFTCTHNLAYILEKLLLGYILLLFLYACLSVYAIFWLMRHSLKDYSFERHDASVFGDIPDVRNDFAFLLHMVDCYDTLYSTRFAVFLSAVSEEKLKELALNSEWSTEKVKAMIRRDAKGRAELEISMLPAIPRSVYEMTEVEVLKLDVISSAKLVGALCQLKALSELYISHCSVKIDPEAMQYLQKQLKVLHVRFTDLEELPSWIYSLKNVHELHLSGNLGGYINKSIRLQSLHGLAGLRSLFLTSNLSHIPPAVLHVAGQLSVLSIQNGDTELGSLGHLKKMNRLIELKLCHCRISKIPSVVSGLKTLECLDLTSNLINIIDESGPLQRLRSLKTFRLCHNSLHQLPSSIEHLFNLEELCLSNNKLEHLPLSLFNLVKLRHLDFSHNSIKVIPPEVGHLTRLEMLAATANQISSLPHELSRCTRLRSLHIGSNKLSSLPPEIGQLPLLSSLELTGNNLTSLPEEISNCLQLKNGGLDVEEHVLRSLSAH